MHRGKNRSRKPVEMSLATPAPSSNASSAASATTATSSPAPTYHRPAAPAAHDAAPYHALYGGGSPYAASARSAAAAYHAAPQVSPFHLHLDTTHPHPPPHQQPPSYYSVDQRDYAVYGHTAKEVGEHAFFSDGTTERDRQQAASGQWQFKNLGMEPKHGAASLFSAGGYGNGAASAYSVDLSKEEDEEERRRQQQQHCFVLGADLRLERPSSGHDAAPAHAQKPLRPFFDEWPHEKANKGGSWMGLDGETQLSMSIPMATNDLPITSRYRNGA
jgi:hypothetical protein